jgi:glycosyltransferase involved in cell wall biosynthesis
MKILQVCSADSIGGGEHHVIDLTRGLIERGHELHLAVRPDSPLRRELAESSIHWHEVKLRNALDLLSAKRLSRLIVAHQIEVVHAHVARDYPVVGLATKNLPVRFFLTRHHFNPIKSSALYETSIRHATKLLAVSEAVRQTLAQAFPTMVEQIEVIPNWLRFTTPLSRQAARQHFGIKRRWAMAIIGQITPLKRQDLFLEAVRLLTANNSYERVEFFIIGTTNAEDSEYEQQLRRTARDIGLEDRVHFTGFVPDLPHYLAAFDVVIAPSDNEGFSLAAIEAMNAGCAVIASEIGGLAELIKHDETGRLFQPGNAPMIVTDLQLLLFDNHFRQRLASAAQMDVRARFDRERILDRIEAIYAANGQGASDSG